MLDDESEAWFDGRLPGKRGVNLCEWMRQRGLPAPLPHPCLVTAALWERLERIPFRIVESTTLDDRVHHLVARARACLQSCAIAKACDDDTGITLAFSASLPCRAEDPSRQILHLRCGWVEGVGASITLGLPDDLPLPPREPISTRASASREERDYSVAPSTRTVSGQAPVLAPHATRSTQN